MVNDKLINKKPDRAVYIHQDLLSFQTIKKVITKQVTSIFLMAADGRLSIVFARPPAHKRPTPRKFLSSGISPKFS